MLAETMWADNPSFRQEHFESDMGVVSKYIDRIVNWADQDPLSFWWESVSEKEPYWGLKDKVAVEKGTW